MDRYMYAVLVRYTPKGPLELLGTYETEDDATDAVFGLQDRSSLELVLIYKLL